MTRRTWRPLVVFVAAGAFASAGACIIWDNGDSPSPIIGPEGILTVTPDKITIPLYDDGDAGGAESFRFVIKGRVAGGLGAESVPVDVVVAPCADSDDFVDASRYREIALVGAPDGGCRTDSPAALRCILSPDGIASFDVRTSGTRATTYEQAIPICVRPPDEDPTSPRQARVFIGSLSDSEVSIAFETDARLAVAVRETSNDCAQGLLADCASVTRARPVRVVARALDGGPVVTNTARAVVNVADVVDDAGGGGAGATLSRTEACDGLAPVLDTFVSSTRHPDEKIFLCARGRRGRVALRAAVVGQSELVAEKEVEIAPQPARVVLLGEDVVVQDCEGRPIAGLAVTLSPEPGVVTDAGGARTTDENGSAGRVSLSGDAGLGDGVVVSIPDARQSCRLKVTR